MAAHANSMPRHVEASNEVITTPASERIPPARTHARRSWYQRPANLASPSSPCLYGGPAPAPVSPYTPLHTAMPEAKRPRKAPAFRDQDVTVQSLDSMMEAAQQTRSVSESASGQEEEVRSYTPDGSPPETSVWGLGFLGDSAPDAEESEAGDDTQVQSPDTPSKVPAEQDRSPTKSARIIDGLLSSPAKVYRSPGQMLITQRPRRWWLTGHNIAKCKRSHGPHCKKTVKESESSAAEA